VVDQRIPSSPGFSFLEKRLDRLRPIFFILKKNSLNIKKHSYLKMQKTNNAICIPRVDNRIPKQKIFETICSLRIGFIERIIETPLKHDDTGKRVVIKFKTWVENETSKRIVQRFQENKDIKIVYNFPWYWIAYPADQQSY
jgi:hypothetical protein